MTGRGAEARLTPGRHAAGASLLALGLATLGLLALLPTRGSAGLELPFLDERMPPVVVAFAGFPGCGTICPASLATIRTAADALPAAGRAQLGLLFVNIERDAPPAQSEAYARAFHPDFRAYSLTSEDAAPVYRALALGSFASGEQAAAHSGYVYVFARADNGWRIERIYRRLPASGRLANDLHELVAAIA